MIEIEGLSAGYPGFSLRDITLTLPEGRMTALIGPNGCGKSTLLATLSGGLRPRVGRVRVDGLDVARTAPKRLARQVALLPQSPLVPPAIRVGQLVAYGRAPWQNFAGIERPGDAEAIAAAMAKAGIQDLAQRRLSELSGGQRQRAFIAMCLAQDTPVMLFDEPTSFLDIRHQVDTLELLAGLAAAGRTVVTVLHDIGQAARYAGHLVVMRDGAIRYAGPPAETVHAEMLHEVYDLPARVYADPVTGTPQLSPERR